MNKIRVSSDRMYPYSAITPVPKGQVKFSKIQFYLSDDWNGRNTIAQFKQGEKTLNIALNSDNTCYIPSDFDIGIVTVYLKGYSLDGFSIATANGVSIPIVQGAFDGGDLAVPPEPDLYVKLIEEFQKGAIPPPAFAEVGQTIVVKAVDEEGKPTEWEAAHFLGGDGTTDHTKLNNRNANDQHPMSAITGLEDALAGKQPTGSYITDETDPTVPAWAKAETKPSYTAPEVGADPSGTAASLVTAHNTEVTAHSDMRLLIQGLTDRLNALADSDDTTLDQLSEIVAYIKSNRDLIAAVTTDKVSVGDIVNDLVTNVANKPISAAQGVALKALIDSLNASDIGAIPVPATASVGQTIRVSAVDENGQPTEWEAVDMINGASEWELINEATLTEDEISEITISEDSNGNPFELSAVYVLIFGKGSVNSGINILIQSTTNEAYKNKFHNFGLLGSCLTTDGKWSAAYIEHIYNTEWNTAFKGSAKGAAGPAATQNYDAYISMNYSTWQAKPDGNIRAVQLTTFSGTFSSGAKLILYGKRV